MARDAAPIDLNVTKVQRFCERKIPARVRGQLVWEVETHGTSITITERRLPWPGAPDPDGPWTKRQIAQFRVDAGGTWSLYWANRNDRWLPVPDAPASPDIDDLLRIVESNRTGAFD